MNGRKILEVGIPARPNDAKSRRRRRRPFVCFLIDQDNNIVGRVGFRYALATRSVSEDRIKFETRRFDYQGDKPLSVVAAALYERGHGVRYIESFDRFDRATWLMANDSLVVTMSVLDPTPPSFMYSREVYA